MSYLIRRRFDNLKSKTTGREVHGILYTKIWTGKGRGVFFFTINQYVFIRSVSCIQNNLPPLPPPNLILRGQKYKEESYRVGKKNTFLFYINNF